MRLKNNPKDACNNYFVNQLQLNNEHNSEIQRSQKNPLCLYGWHRGFC